ncbi:glycosyltransferase family 4 protein [Vibrio breoganii]|uniref:glycosyltransferase family 4 protein n=1 Tax=Vibrio breoganii TaxID=553239 RepID=UPI0010BDBCED|nr:glycosyltransferase family 4 protein [Vibrio breoganii]TKG24509.1 glycosyltransferase family 4 protein [Vibrio breoganii]
MKNKSEFLNVVFLVKGFNSFSGAAKQALVLSKAIKPKVKKITILNIDNKFEVERYVDGIKVITVRKLSILSYLKVVCLLKVGKVDIVHSQGFFFDFIPFLYFAGIKYIIKSTMYNSDDFLSLKKSKFGQVKLFFAKKCVANNSLTQQMRKVNQTFLPNEKIFTIPNAVAIPNENPNKRNLALFVGGIIERKRPDLAIRFFVNNFPDNYELLIIGPTTELSDFDKPYFDNCINISKSNTHFLGLLSKDKVQEYMRAAKCILFFSEQEGLPNVVLEAMSYNCIPFISDMDGLSREIIPSDKEHFIINNPYEDKVQDIDCLIEDTIKSNYFRKLAVLRYHKDIIAKSNIEMYIDACE